MTTSVRGGRARAPTRQPLSQPLETTTDALQLFLREAGRHALLTAAQEVSLAQAASSAATSGR